MTTIKSFPYIEDIHLENAAGKKLYCRFGNDVTQGVVTVSEVVLPNGMIHKLEPATMAHIEFLMERASDPTYVDTEPKLKAFEAGGRQHALRHQLRIQKEQAKERGTWELRDEPSGPNKYVNAEDDYRRLYNAVTNPKAKISMVELIEFNCHRFGQAVCDVSTPAEEAVAKPTNGAAAEHAAS